MEKMIKATTISIKNKEMGELLKEFANKCRNKPCINCDGVNFSTYTLPQPLDGISRIEVVCENCNHIMHYRLPRELIEKIEEDMNK